MTDGPTQRPSRDWRQLIGPAVVVLLALGVVMIVIGGLKAGGPPSPSAAQTSDPATSDLRTGVLAPAPDPAEGTPHTAPAEPIVPVQPLPRSTPVQLDVPSINVRTRLSSVGLHPDGTVEVPPLDKNAPAGWYRYLSSPGETGPAVILGHVDSARDGPAVFYRLGQVRRGDPISVTRADGWVAVFTVRSVIEVSKSAFPTAAVYGPTSAAELRLVTCGGRFDRSRHSYVDNIIVYATLSSVSQLPA
jgi:hypothetical protein